VYGLDINPRAIKISWIKLYLNALHESFSKLFCHCHCKRSFVLRGYLWGYERRVEFDESDLLAYCRHHDIQLEGIVGCRPQVLNPNSNAMSKIITENASEEFLYSLSNYCGLQVGRYSK
ncbi:hypothetical protein CISIN_1g042087mg, partial [Citrus sinensis]